MFIIIKILIAVWAGDVFMRDRKKNKFRYIDHLFELELDELGPINFDDNGIIDNE